jgi:hypothetical protein
VVAWNEATVQILGIGTDFAIGNIEGAVSVLPERGTLPAKVKVAASKPETMEFSFEVSLPAMDKKLRCSGVLLASEWDVKFYRWPAAGPKTPPAKWDEVLASPAVYQTKLPALDFRWEMGGPENVASDYFATIATTELELPPGEWEISTVSDDGIRVYVDDRLAIDNWTWHGPTRDVARTPIHGGKHSVRIEHFEIDGWAQLQFIVRRAKKAG